MLKILANEKKARIYSNERKLDSLLFLSRGESSCSSKYLLDRSSASGPSIALLSLYYYCFLVRALNLIFLTTLVSYKWSVDIFCNNRSICIAEDIDMLINRFCWISYGSKGGTCHIELHRHHFLLFYYIFYIEISQPLSFLFSNNNWICKIKLVSFRW